MTAAKPTAGTPPAQPPPAAHAAARAPSPPPYSRHTPLSAVMARPVVTLQVHDRSSAVDLLMQHHAIHHLPVLEGDVLRGVISQRDLYRSMLSTVYYGQHEREQQDFLDRCTDISGIMTPDPLTLGPQDTLGDAVRLMRGRSIGCVPVVDGRNRLLGIVTESDLLRVLEEVLPS